MRALGASRTSVATGGILGANWARNPLWKTARAVPSLDLCFADNKSLVDANTGAQLVTFTRASSGTYVGSDGLIKTAATNEPRFDHNPTTGESLGLLVEEARTNLLLQSNQFDSTWTNTNSSETAASGTAPDGTNTAWELKDTLDVVVTSHQVNQTISFTSGISYTFTCWMKAGTLTQGGFVLPTAAFSSGINCRINLLTGSVLSSSATLAASTTLYPNGWVRVTAVATATATAGGSAAIRIMDGATSYIGTGNGTILIWGAQLETGAFATSYIPTTTATVTRAADVASITGSNFSSWYQGNTGTLFFEGANPASSTTAFAVSDGSTNNRLQMDSGTNTRVARVVSGGTTQANNSLTYTFGVSQKFGMSYTTDAINFANAGVLGTEDTSATIPTVDQLRIGANPTGANPLNNTIKRLTYWPTRLNNTTLQQLTQP
jgi:hypothetical protein